MSLNMGTAGSGLLAPESLKLLPLYILALLKYVRTTNNVVNRNVFIYVLCL